ncbi:MAG: YitT family protein [Clostridia bacterium]|nr:YitT family protein [Clostridia bacterium]
MDFGTAIILKVNSSTGGTDLISYIAREYRPTISMSRAIIILDIIIVSLNVFFFKEIEIGLYSAIAIYLMGKMIDILFEGIYFTKLLLIVSDKNEEIAKQIGEKIKRGTTGLFGKGMYTNEEKLVLMCATSRREIAKIKMIARKIDPQSFIIITNSREVLGLGFKRS